MHVLLHNRIEGDLMIYETLPEEVGTSLADDHPGGYTEMMDMFPVSV